MITQPDFDRLKQETQARLTELLGQFEGLPNSPELRDRIQALVFEYVKNNLPVSQHEITGVHFDPERGILRFFLPNPDEDLD